MEFFVYNVKTLITWPLHYVLVEIRLRPHPLFVFFWGVHVWESMKPPHTPRTIASRDRERGTRRVPPAGCGGRVVVPGCMCGGTTWAASSSFSFSSSSTPAQQRHGPDRRHSHYSYRDCREREGAGGPGLLGSRV